MLSRFLVLLLLSILCLSESAMAQKIVYVRAAGNDASDGSTETSANRTIQGALQDAVAGDILDVGPGTFEGATIPFAVTMKGANSGAELARWTAPTLMKSPFVLSKGDVPIEVTFDGITFGQITPVTGKSPNAIVSISNCVFNASKPLTTEGLEWSELVVVGCVFNAKVKDVAAVSDRAVVASGVSVAYLAESYYKDYTKTAVSMQGVLRMAKLQYNEFTNCNSSGAQDCAAIRFDLDNQEPEVEIHKNLISNCKHGIQTSGDVAGKSVSVQFNTFISIPTSFAAIAHKGTGPLNATCNAIQLPKTDRPLERDAMQQAFSKLFIGEIDAFPLNDKAEDVDGSAVGFEPRKDQECSFTKQ